MDAEFPIIGTFKRNRSLLLAPLPNGGWLVQQPEFAPGAEGNDVGAYSNSADMLEALTFALRPGSLPPIQKD